MADYISRDDVLKAIDYQHEVNNVFDSEAAYVQMWETINDDMGIKSADVQPVNQWISSKDRLPEPEKEVLVWYRYTWGAGFTAYRFGISRWYSNIKRWYEGCLPKDIEVLYWQPLPEPPKDGESNG